MNSDNKYAWLLTGLYFVVALAGILRHELWLDEAHHFLMARDSDSLEALWQVTRPDGHPVLWNVLLYLITRLTPDIVAMQILHVLIATAAVFVFVRKAPFPWVFKLLFIFGYFMIFEYCLISRNYMLGILFLFLACSVLRQRHIKHALLCLYLALAANIHLMFSVIALAFFLTLLLEDFSNRQLLAKGRIAGYAIFGTGIILLYVQMATTQSHWFFTMIGDMGIVEKCSKGYIALFKGLITIPDFRTIHFWNINLIIEMWRPLAAVVALALFAVPLVLFYKNRKVLFFAYVAIAGAMVFYFVTMRDATRFYGLPYLIVIIALWLYNALPKENPKITERLDRWKLFLLQKPIVYGVLIIHFVSGIIAYSLDFRYAFTPAKDVAAYLKEHQIDTLPVSCLTCDGTSISPYLERKMWFLCMGSYESYCHWESLCGETPDNKEILSMLSDFMKTHPRAVYISYLPLLGKLQADAWVDAGNGIRIKYLTQFTGETIVPHDYYIFEISHVE